MLWAAGANKTPEYGTPEVRIFTKPPKGTTTGHQLSQEKKIFQIHPHNLELWRSQTFGTADGVRRKMSKFRLFNIFCIDFIEKTKNKMRSGRRPLRGLLPPLNKTAVYILYVILINYLYQLAKLWIIPNDQLTWNCVRKSMYFHERQNGNF